MSAVAEALAERVCVDCDDGLVLAVVYRMRVDRRVVSLCDEHAWPRLPRDFGWLPPLPCEWCGGTVIRAAGIRSVCCSSACCELARRARQTLKRRGGLVLAPRECEGGDHMFMPTRIDKRTCGDACRQAAARKRADEPFADGVSRREWAHLGNPALGVVWCSSCRANAMPIRRICPWCDTPIGGDRNAIAA